MGSCEVSHWGLKSFHLLEFISPQEVWLSLSITEEPNPDSCCAEGRPNLESGNPGPRFAPDLLTLRSYLSALLPSFLITKMRCLLSESRPYLWGVRWTISRGIILEKHLTVTLACGAVFPNIPATDITYVSVRQAGSFV